MSAIRSSCRAVLAALSLVAAAPALQAQTAAPVAEAPQRVIPLATGSNFRDIGGYAAADGRHVRWGLIYRSGATPLLSPADLARIEALHLANLVDLRSDEERALAPTRIDGVPYTAVGYSMNAMMTPAGGFDIQALYRAFPTLLAPQLRIIFHDLAAGAGPIAYNCSAGQDRTGFVTAIVLSALGVPRPTIYQDYLLSTRYRHPAYEMPPISPALAATSPIAAFFAKAEQSPHYATPAPLYGADGVPYLTLSFDAITARWGSVDGYLHQEIGLSDADVAAIRSRYLM